MERSQATPVQQNELKTKFAPLFQIDPIYSIHKAGSIADAQKNRDMPPTKKIAHPILRQRSQ